MSKLLLGGASMILGTYILAIMVTPLDGVLTIIATGLVVYGAYLVRQEWPRSRGKG